MGSYTAINQAIKSVRHAKGSKAVRFRAHFSFWDPHTNLVRWESSAIDNIIEVAFHGINCDFRKKPPRRVRQAIRPRSRVFCIKQGTEEDVVTRRWEWRPRSSSSITVQHRLPGIVMIVRRLEPKVSCRKHCFIKVHWCSTLFTALAINWAMIQVDLRTDIAHALPESNHRPKAASLHIGIIHRDKWNAFNTCINNLYQRLNQYPRHGITAIHLLKGVSRRQNSRPWRHNQVLYHILGHINPLGTRTEVFTSSAVWSDVRMKLWWQLRSPPRPKTSNNGQMGSKISRGAGSLTWRRQRHIIVIRTTASCDIRGHLSIHHW